MKVLALASILFFSLSSQAQQLLDLGRYRAERFGNTQTISINSFGLSEIIIQNLNDKTKVLNARIYTDRGTYNLRTLEHELRDNQRVNTRLDPRDYVYSLQLDVASSFRGSRGEYQVLARVDRVPPRQPPRPDPRPPVPPRPPSGAYDPTEGRIVYDQIVNFGWSVRGLNVSRTEAESMAREWTRRGRYCGSSWEIDNMTRDFERRADTYRRQRHPDRTARQYALNDIRYMSQCTDIFYVR